MRAHFRQLVRSAATIACVAAAIVAVPSVTLAQASIDLPSDGTPYWHPFGKPDTQTYGETFRTPDATNTVLNNFSFWMTSNPDGLFQAYVYAWDPTLGHAVGSALFTSAVMSEPASGGGVYQMLINTGGLSLNPLDQYVAFFSTSGLGGSGTTQWGHTNATYAEGSFVYFNNGDNFGALTTTRWDGQGLQGNAFNANFSPVAAPEPASVVLLATGLVGLIGVARKKNRV